MELIGRMRRPKGVPCAFVSVQLPCVNRLDERVLRGEREREKDRDRERERNQLKQKQKESEKAA